MKFDLAKDRIKAKFSFLQKMLDFVLDDCKRNDKIARVNYESLFEFEQRLGNSSHYVPQNQNNVFELGKLILYVDSTNPSKFVKDCFLNPKYSHSKLKPHKERIKKRPFRKVKESSLVFLLLDKCLETKPKEKVDFRFLKSFLSDIKKAFQNVYKKAFSFYRKQHEKAKNCHQKPHSLFRVDNEFSFKRKQAQGISIPPIGANLDKISNPNSIKNVFQDKEPIFEMRPQKIRKISIIGNKETDTRQNKLGESQSENPSSRSLSRIESIKSNFIAQQLPDSQWTDLHSRSNTTCGISNFSSNSTTSAQHPKTSRTFTSRRTSYKKLPKSDVSVSPEIRSYIQRNCLKKKRSDKLIVGSKIVSRLVSRLDCIKKSCSQTSSNLSSSSFSPSHVSTGKSGSSQVIHRANLGRRMLRMPQQKANKQIVGLKGKLSRMQKSTRSQPGSRRMIRAQSKKVFK